MQIMLPGTTVSFTPDTVVADTLGQGYVVILQLPGALLDQSGAGDKLLVSIAGGSQNGWNVQTADSANLKVTAPLNAIGGVYRIVSKQVVAGATTGRMYTGYVSLPLPTINVSPGSLDICTPGPSTATWTTGGGDTAAFTVSGNMQPSVPGSVPVNSAGTFIVSPSQTTTYTLTETGLGGPVVAQATVTVGSYVYDTQTPDVTTGVASYFGQGQTVGGRIIAAGTYRIRYVGGSYRYDTQQGYAVDGGGASATSTNPNMGGVFSGFHVTDGRTSSPLTPGVGGVFAVPGDAQAASAASPDLLYVHTGGPLGVFLGQQALGYKNAPGLGPTPTFSVLGPMPTAALAAAPAAIRAGQASTLTWTTAVGAASLDSGIGSVAAAGTLAVYNSVDTVYTLTSALACVSASASASVRIIQPGVPLGFSASASGASILLAALAPASVLNFPAPGQVLPGSQTADGYIFSRGTVSGGPYTAVSTGTAQSYSDGTATSGVLYFYTCQGYIGSSVSPVTLGQYKVSAYCPEVSAYLPVLPTQPQNVIASAGSGMALVRWTPMPPAFPYGQVTASLFRGTSPGGESAIPAGANLSSPYFVDKVLPNGVTFYYTVRFANAAGVGPVSAEVSATPQINLTVKLMPSYQISPPGSSPVQDFLVAQNQAQKAQIDSITRQLANLVTALGTSAYSQVDTQVITGAATTFAAPLPVPFAGRNIEDYIRTLTANLTDYAYATTAPGRIVQQTFTNSSASGAFIYTISAQAGDVFNAPDLAAATSFTLARGEARTFTNSSTGIWSEV